MNALKNISDKPNCFHHNPSKPFKSLHSDSALRGGNASVVDYVFSFRHKTPFFPNPLTESIESGSQSTIREALGLVWRMKIQVCTIVLKEFAIKLFKARSFGRGSYQKNLLAISSPLI